MTYCNEALAVKTDGKSKTAVTLRCRSWTCEECADLRHRQLVAEGICGSPRVFITITSKRVSTKTPIQAARELAHAWRKLRLRIMRKYGWKKLPFLCVFQATKLGWPHLHILARCGYIDQRWLSAQMDDLTGSPIVDIRLLKNRSQAVAYAARYCGRETERFGTTKRYWQSQDYDLRPEPPPKEDYAPGVKWERLVEALDRWVTSQSRQGWHAWQVSRHKAVAVRLLE